MNVEEIALAGHGKGVCVVETDKILISSCERDESMHKIAPIQQSQRMKRVTHCSQSGNDETRAGPVNSAGISLSRFVSSTSETCKSVEDYDWEYAK